MQSEQKKYFFGLLHKGHLSSTILALSKRSSSDEDNGKSEGAILSESDTADTAIESSIYFVV